MHLLAERIIVKHLIAIGIIKNAPLEELEEKRIGAIFFPHGLGHLIVKFYNFNFLNGVFRGSEFMMLGDIAKANP
jgi:hypothetical protein